MPAYRPPLDDMRFVLREIVDLEALRALPPFAEVSDDLVEAVLEEAGKFGVGELAPLNASGDREGCVWDDGEVRTPAGFKEAYRDFVEAGWNSVPFDPDYGGQGLPWAVALAVQEIWHSANMSFGLCPMLTGGSVELLQVHGSDAQKQAYLPKLISGEWTGTMCLTEPQAGSDLGQLRTKATPVGDGSYRVEGQKIYITFGEHDMADNIIHMVLARLPDAPPGVKGISLFLVPKFLLDADGQPGERNDLRCVSIEHKMGIHGSPTAVIAFGDGGGAIGWLVGEPHKGLACMFTMMNNARLGVGLEGVAISERAYQRARAYARERVQGKDMGTGEAKVPIVRHPDVRRMLLTIRATTEAARAMTYYVGSRLDVATHHPDPEARAEALSLVELLTPVIKAWATDLGVSNASLGILVLGGLGFVEETGAAQHLRDARIAPIYEGTNGIQAADLVFRKVQRDGGAAMRALIDEMGDLAAELAERSESTRTIGTELVRGVDALRQATKQVLAFNEAESAAASATSFLELTGIVSGGYFLARCAAKAEADLRDGRAYGDFAEAKLAVAEFYATQVLPRAEGLVRPVAAGQRAVMSLPEELL